MNLKEYLLAELEREVDRSRHALEQVPEGKSDWKPHEKSMQFGYLVNMVATIPMWIGTSFSHARNWKREDSVPKIAFGKFIKTEERTLLPFSVEVHHALMDGLHVGRFVTWLEKALLEPETYLNS